RATLAAVKSLRLRGPILIALAASRGVKRCSSTGGMVSISSRIIPRQADSNRSIPGHTGKSFVREEAETKSGLILLKGKRTQPPCKILDNDSDRERFMSTLRLPGSRSGLAQG